jgi:hypothetical protein
VHGDDQIEFRFGTRWDGFEFVFEADALQAFIEAATDAMEELKQPVEAG